MSFIAKHIANNDERLIYVARLHWVTLMKGFLWFVAFSVFGIAAEQQLLKYFNPKPIVLSGLYLGSPFDIFRIAMILAGAFILLTYAIAYFFTEVALTNRRIIYKKGMISTEVEEIDLVEIRGENISHGILGRLMGYGRLHLDSRFVEDINLPIIRKPYRLLQAMHRTRGQEHPATAV
jgi:uncharacterized membrane protein YdbT with pleckstrin-like domain